MRLGLLIALLGVGLAFHGLTWADDGKVKGKGLWNGDDGVVGKEKGKGKGKGKDKDKDKDEDGDDQGGGKGKGAGKGKGVGKDKDRPHGWDQGQKKGWHDEYPPGWSKKSEEEKAKWKKDLEDAKDLVGTEADKKGVSKEEKSKLREAVERMCRKGREFKQATGEVVEKMKKGKNAIEIMKENGIVIEVGG